MLGSMFLRYNPALELFAFSRAGLTVASTIKKTPLLFATSSENKD